MDSTVTLRGHPGSHSVSESIKDPAAELFLYINTHQHANALCSDLVEYNPVVGGRKSHREFQLNCGIIESDIKTHLVADKMSYINSYLI